MMAHCSFLAHYSVVVVVVIIVSFSLAFYFL